MSIQAMRQALEALGICESMLPEYHQWLSDAQYYLIAAIEAAEKQEPAAWVFHIKRTNKTSIQSIHLAAIEYYPESNEEILGKEPLYTNPQPTIPEGWQLVPVEPTEEMIASTDGEYRSPVNVFKTMLAAAPKPEEMK